MTKKIIVFITCILFIGCGIYTFSGSTLPSHLKTVNIPLFLNQSLQPGIAEELTAVLNETIQDNRLLKTVTHDPDATFIGKVLSYKNHPYSYDSKLVREVDVSSYCVEISVDIEFIDNRENKTLYKGVITEEGIYNFNDETEKDGQEEVINKIVERIMQNSVQSW